MAAPAPRMHGRTHVPGGPDPIPGLTGGGGFGSFQEEVAALAATRDLRGYWRLGDGASPFAEISGHAPGPAPAAKIGTGTAMTASISGALPAVDDDGAVRFNDTAGAAAELLHAAEPGTPFRFNLNGPQTVACWVTPAASTNSFFGVAVGNWVTTTVECGWRLGITWPARTPTYQRRSTPSGTNRTLAGPAVPAAAWSFLVGTYDSAAGASLYVNGALVASDPLLFEGLPGANDGVTIGAVRPGAAAAPYSFCGGVDEVTVWGAPLTADEILTLYHSGMGGIPGPPGPPGTTPDISGKVDKDAVEAATNRLVQVKLASGDTQPAFKIQGDGKHLWGPGGTTAPDLDLFRGAASILKTNQNLEAAGTMTAAAGSAYTVATGYVTAGPGMLISGDTNLYRSAAATLKTDGYLVAKMAATDYGADLAAAATINVTAGIHRITSGTATITTITGGVAGGVVTLINRTGADLGVTTAGNILMPRASYPMAINEARQFFYSVPDGKWQAIVA